MIKAKDTPSKTAAEVELLGEERQRLGRVERQLTDRLARDLTNGQVIFRGKVDDAPAGTLTQSAQKLMTERISEIYDRLDSFAAQLSTKDVMTVLRTDDLGTVNEALTESGIGLVRLTPAGSSVRHRLRPARRPAQGGQERDELRTRRHRAPCSPRSWLPRLAVRRSRSSRPLQPPRCAPACSRSRTREPRSADPSDHRLDRVFGKISDFRGSSFAPPTAGPDVETRVELAANLGKLTGTKPPIDAAGLAAALRQFFAADSEAAPRSAPA